MAIDSYRYCRNVFGILDRKLFRFRLPMMNPGITIKWTLSNSDSSFTRPTSHKGVFVVNIGLEMASKVFGFGRYFVDKNEAKKYLKSLSWLYQGLVYHEDGHLTFTDMYADDIWKYKDPDYVGFISSFSNIVEDFVIENFGMARKFPFTKKYFAFLVRAIHLPTVPLYNDGGDAPSFLNFLLLKLRCGKAMKAAGKGNKVWEDNEATLKPMLLDCLREPDAHERILKCIKFCEWLFANVPNVDWKMSPPDPSSFTGPGSMANSGSSPGSAPLNTMPRRSKNGLGKASQSSSSGSSSVGQCNNNQGSTDIQTSDNAESHSGDFNPIEAGDLDQTDQGSFEEGYDPSNDIPIEDLPECHESTSSHLGGDDEHVFIDAKSYYIPNDFVLSEIDSLIQGQLPISNGIRIAFNKFSAHIKPRLNGGFHSGRLDTRAVIRQNLNKTPDTKLFMRRVPRGLAPDVAFSILCDNSGSMGGNKSFVTTRAMIAFAKACDLCHLPCEVNLFVDGVRTNATITLKDFSDSFKESKAYFGIAHSNLISNYTFDYRSIPSFDDNVDEVNLYNVWKRFRKNPHKDKVLIVISDGLTCGSTADLTNLVQKISSEGCFVIGIGIQSRAVANIYPHYKIFDSAESLNGLPGFMSQMVMDIIAGKE